MTIEQKDRIESRNAFALSHEEAAFYRQELMRRGPCGSHKAMLVSIQGWIVQSGRYGFAFTNAEQQSILDSEWYQDLIIDASLIHGQLRFPKRLHARLTSWNDFGKFWEQVYHSHPHPESIKKVSLDPFIAPFIPKSCNFLPDEQEKDKAGFNFWKFIGFY